MTVVDIDSIARRYIETVGNHDLAPLDELFDQGLVANFAGTPCDKATWIAALGRLLPVLIRNDIQEIYTAGDRACVVYDFVTDSDAGAVRCVELLTVENGRIQAIELILDRVAFAPVNKALSERVASGR
jgi:ketosteroid isomerase-like protein